jgi:hypothetical protein
MDETVQFNINIADYTLQDLLALLDIKINKDTEINQIKREIKEKTQKYIEQFKELNKPSIVNFFKVVRTSLLGTDEDESLSLGEKLLLKYDKQYKPFSNSNSVVSSTEDLFSQNSGAGNPINRKTVTKLLNIDSRFRENYTTSTSTDFIINLPYPVNNIIETRLCDLEFAASYHPINTTNQNNYFWFATYTAEQILNNNPNIYYFVIPDGNYYFENLITLMNTIFKQINPNLPISAYCDLNYNNTGNIGTGTGKVSIGILPNSTEDISLNIVEQIVKFELNFDSQPLPNVIQSTRVIDTDLISKYYQTSTIPLEQRFGWMIGYRNPHYRNSLYYISESIIDLSGPKYFFLIVDDFNQNTNINFINTSKYGLLPDNIIARISVKCPVFSSQAENDYSVYSEPRYYYGPVNVSKLRVKVIDEYNRVINLNSNDFSFTLRMTTIYSIT